MPAPPLPTDDRDRVVLRVPADPRYARVVRVAVTAYAIRLGLAPAAIEDLRLAVDEALILLMGSSSPTADRPEAREESDIVLVLDADDDRPPVTVELGLDPSPRPAEPDLAARSRFGELVPASVAVAVVDQHQGRVTLRHGG